MQIKFLNAKNFKTFSLVAAIVLIVFQVIKSASNVVAQIGFVAMNISNFEWLRFAVVPPICQNIIAVIAFGYICVRSNNKGIRHI